MLEVYERIYVGDLAECFIGQRGWGVVHACKYPCHQRAVGYRGNLASSHPNYLVLEQDCNLYLNIIDPERPLFQRATFTVFLDFALRHWTQGEKLLIHCNRGESRAPSLALLFMACRLGVVDSSSFDSAAKQFARIYPSYYPGYGIQRYLRQEWNRI